MERRDDHVGLAVGGVAVAQLAGDAVDRGDRVAEVEVGDARGADQGLGLLGDGADHADVDAVDVERARTPAGPGSVVPLA